MAKENDKSKHLPVEEANSGNGKDEDVYTLDPSDSMDVETAVATEKPETQKELEALKKEKSEIYDRLLRKQADFENFRKRAERDKREFQAYALSEFVTELLPILDNFERALAHPDDQISSDYRKGVELIHRQFRDLMEKRGLTAIETKGQAFDPNFHEAILREERNDLPENTILAELQKGYYFRDKLLRPAMVKVSYRSEEVSDPDIQVIDVEE